MLKGLATLGVALLLAATIACDQSSPTDPNTDEFTCAVNVVTKVDGVEAPIYGARVAVQTVGLSILDRDEDRTDESGFSGLLYLRIGANDSEPREVYVWTAGAVGFQPVEGIYQLREVWNPRLGKAVPVAKVEVSR